MIRQLSKGRYEVQVYVRRDPATGKRIRISRTVRGTLKDARHLEAKLLLQVHEHQPDVAASAPMRAVLANWLEQIRPRVAASTWVGYEQKVRLYLEPQLGDVPLGELTRGRVNEAYRALAERTTRRGQPMSAQTVHHCHAVLHAALEYAVEDGWIVRNPAARAVVPTVAESTVTAPTEDQVVELLRAAQARGEISVAEGGDPMLHPFLAVAVSTGARRGAVCGLRWNDVDLDAGTITFRRALTDAGGTLAEKGPKTGKPRAKRIGPATVDVLKSWRTRQKAKALELGTKVRADAWVFSWDGRTPEHPGTISKRYARLAAAADLPVRLHDLRHFSVTHALAGGVPLKDVQDRHDHASGRMTLDVYGHALPAGDLRSAELMDEVVART